MVKTPNQSSTAFYRPYSTTQRPRRTQWPASVRSDRRFKSRPSLSAAATAARRMVDEDDLRLNNYDESCWEDDDRDDTDVQPAEEQTFIWTDEKTLVSDLIDAPVSDSDGTDKHVNELCATLQKYYEAEGTDVAQDIAHTSLSAVSEIRKSHASLLKKFDQPFGAAILAFNDVCKIVETMRSEEEEVLKDATSQAKAELEGLFVDLENAYSERKGLWKKLERTLNDMVVPTQETLKNAPVKLERTITGLEKHARNFKEDSGDSTLQAILSKLS